MKIDAKKLSDLLRGLMGDNNAAEMARRIGVNAQTLRAYIRGEINSPTKEFVYEIASYMNVDFESLVEQLALQPSPMVANESAVLYYLTASDAIPVLKKMPPKEKLKVAKYLIDDAV